MTQERKHQEEIRRLTGKAIGGMFAKKQIVLDFCRIDQPWGLGMDPVKFRAYLAADVGQRALDLMTVATSQQGERTDLEEETSAIRLQKSNHETTRRLRAILRAPELIQTLYKDGLVSQATAALMGPKKPDEDKATAIVRARQAVEDIPLPDSEDKKGCRAYRRQVDHTIRTELDKSPPSLLERLQHAYERLSEEDRQAFLAWLHANEVP